MEAVTAVLNSDASDKKEEFIEVRKRTKTITSSDALVEVEAEEGCEVIYLDTLGSISWIKMLFFV